MPFSSDTASITATGNYALDKNPDEGACLVQIAGTYAGITFTFEASLDGTNYFQVAVLDQKTGAMVAGGTAVSPADNAEYCWLVPNALGYSKVRLVVSAWTSGTGALTSAGLPSSSAPVPLAPASSQSTFTGGVVASGIRAAQTTPVAVTAATTLVLADSGGIFNIDQDAAFDIDLPSPTDGAGREYVLFIGDAGANNVTVTVAGSAATFVGVIVNDVTSVIPATGSTLTFASGVAAVGDVIIVRSVSTTLYHVVAICSANGGITVA